MKTLASFPGKVLWVLIADFRSGARLGLSSGTLIGPKVSGRMISCFLSCGNPSHRPRGNLSLDGSLRRFNRRAPKLSRRVCVLVLMIPGVSAPPGLFSMGGGALYDIMKAAFWLIPASEECFATATLRAASSSLAPANFLFWDMPPA